jgi:dolichyl-phosphate-mannose--protein O-mannosyl transferase
VLSRTNTLFLTAAALLFLLGAWLRFSSNTAYRQPGFDELLYRENVQSLEAVGPFEYGAVVEHYLEKQRIRETQAELPPTRFLYIFTGWIWKTAQFGSGKPERLNRNPEYAFENDKWLIALRNTSALGSTLLLALSGVAAWRWAGRGAGLAALALMAFAPLQIHTSQHAMIDGFFSFWAMLCLWLLWENLHQPNRLGWLVPLGLAFTALVLTKENAFFVFMGMLAILAVNPWAKFGQVTKGLLLSLLLG